MGNSNKPDELEQRSGEIVSRYLGGSLVFADVVGAQETPDWRIDLPNGRHIALEVTTSARGDVLAQFDAISSRGWEAPSLTMSWSISIPHGAARIKDLHARVESLLSALEAEGIVGFNWSTNVGTLSPDARATVSALRQLSVRIASSVPNTSGSRSVVCIGVSGPANTAGADDVNTVVEKEALANAHKLAGAGANEGHLFVWIDPSNPGPSVPIFLGTLPRSAPQLPTGVDVVWVGIRPRPANLGKLWAQFLWRWTRTSGWENLVVPTR